MILILSLSIKYCLKATINNGGSIRSHLFVDTRYAKIQNKIKPHHCTDMTLQQEKNSRRAVAQSS